MFFWEFLARGSCDLGILRSPGRGPAQVGGSRLGGRKIVQKCFLHVSKMSQKASKGCLRIVLSFRNPLSVPRCPSGDGSGPRYNFCWKLRSQSGRSHFLNSPRKVAGAARVCCLSHINPLHTTAAPATSWSFLRAFGGHIAQPKVALPIHQVTSIPLVSAHHHTSTPPNLWSVTQKDRSGVRAGVHGRAWRSRRSLARAPVD